MHIHIVWWTNPTRRIDTHQGIVFDCRKVELPTPLNWWRVDKAILKESNKEPKVISPPPKLKHWWVLGSVDRKGPTLGDLYCIKSVSLFDTTFWGRLPSARFIWHDQDRSASFQVRRPEGWTLIICNLRASQEWRISNRAPKEDLYQIIVFV